MSKRTFDEWYEHLTLISAEYGELISIADWIIPYEAGMTPEEAFFSEYPEFR